MIRNVAVAIVTTIVVGLGIAFQVTTATTHEERSPDAGTHAPQDAGDQAPGTGTPP